MKAGRPADDLTGWVGDYFTVLRRYGTYQAQNGKSRAVWLCRCGCGVEFACPADTIKSGQRKSCGCLVYLKFNERKVKIRDFAGKSHAGACGAERGKDRDMDVPL